MPLTSGPRPRWRSTSSALVLRLGPSSARPRKGSISPPAPRSLVARTLQRSTPPGLGCNSDAPAWPSSSQVQGDRPSRRLAPSTSRAHHEARPKPSMGSHRLRAQALWRHISTARQPSSPSPAAPVRRQKHRSRIPKPLHFGPSLATTALCPQRISSSIVAQAPHRQSLLRVTLNPSSLTQSNKPPAPPRPYATT